MFWERNLFTDGRPALEAVVESPYVRGGVTGVGIVTGIAGLAELAAIFSSRARREPPEPSA